jgi:hypothetical protein
MMVLAKWALMMLCALAAQLSAGSSSRSLLEFWNLVDDTCQMTKVNDGKLTTSDCSGSVLVLTIDSDRIIPCAKLKEIVIHGPFILNFTKCTFFGIGKPVCHPGVDEDMFGIPQCYNKHKSTYVAVISILTLSILSLIILCR